MNKLLFLWFLSVCLGAADAPPPKVAPLPLREALLVALERNQQLRIQRLTPEIAATTIDTAQAAFDPQLSASLAQERSKASVQGVDEGIASTTTGQANITENLPSGTSLSLGIAISRTHQDWTDTAYAETRAGITVTQSLLKGCGLGANLANLHQARLDAEISGYELRGYAESLVATVEGAYWDVVLAEQQVSIVAQALDVAKQQLAQTRELIGVGKLAEVELVAAEAEAALRQGNSIDARANRASACMNLLRLMNRSLTGDLVLANAAFVPDPDPSNAEEHLAVALLLRADLNQARLLLRRDALEVVKTRNGLLPRLDLFVTLGRTGYAESFHGSIAGQDVKGWDGTVGLSFTHALGNRDGEAAHRRSTLSEEQQRESIANQEQLAEADVRQACLERDRSREQIAASAATSRLQEEKARVEREKLWEGTSTTLLVAQAERELLTAQLSAAKAVVTYLKSLIDLYRLDGSLLDRRGLAFAYPTVDRDRP